MTDAVSDRVYKAARARSFCPSYVWLASRAIELAADCVEKVRRAERPADPFVSPKRVELRIVRVGVEPIREIGDTVPQRLDADQGVVHAGQVRAHAGVRPFRRPRDQSRAHGIEQDIADGGDQMIFIHRQRPEATLEQVSGLPSPRIEVSGIETVRPRQRQRQAPAGSDGARTRWT